MGSFTLINFIYSGLLEGVFSSNLARNISNEDDTGFLRFNVTIELPGLCPEHCCTKTGPTHTVLQSVS
ncbi:MAG: hypothetical protein M1393_01355 [Candidatus Thermoplasmatota archaeon]|nr:hypothetical protein [Candidatus Thermoplasmatota archaeon]